MGNNTSTTSKSGTPGSSTTPTHHGTSISAPGSASGSLSGHDSPRHHRREPRNIIAAHTGHRAVVPPEASLAQAQGSTVVNRPKSLPTTAVSSLSGSPHGSGINSPSRAAAAAAAAAAESRPFVRDEPSKPVDVPTESTSLRSHHSAQAAQVDTHLVSNSSITDMYLRGPPRLPLPIEEEVHTPGSPILAPEEGDALPDGELGETSDGGGLVRKGSTLSATTVDEEDAEELRIDKTRPVVPTRIEWKRGGERVYVTGTIFQWSRKHRLHPVEGMPGWFAATIHILPGTHHIRFLVDGFMQTSPDLPTTVDFGNNLVNYIEVSPEDAFQKQAKAAPKSEDEQVPARTEVPSKVPKGKAVPPPESYRSQIPQYLLDYDQAEDSPAYHNALGAIDKLATPPALPGFLAKPILNAATLMKDDNSVLNMPNHTVLNHLATSSIKNNVLAVSATTRYRSKYVTTIIYKPSSADEG